MTAIPPLVPQEATFHPTGKTWPGPMPLTRTLPKLDATERPMRLLGDALGRAGVRPWAMRPTASGEGVVLTLGVEDVEQLSRSIVEPDADPSCEGCCW